MVPCRIRRECFYHPSSSNTRRKSLKTIEKHRDTSNRNEKTKPDWSIYYGYNIWILRILGNPKPISCKGRKTTRDNAWQTRAAQQMTLAVWFGLKGDQKPLCKDIFESTIRLHNPKHNVNNVNNVGNVWKCRNRESYETHHVDVSCWNE